MAKTSPTQRTLKYLEEEEGLKSGMVERWIPNPRLPGGGIRKDLFGFIDIISISKINGIVGIQSCGSSFAEHYRKITIDKAKDTYDWLEAGGRLKLIGWRKVKKVRGGKLMIWKPRIKEITLEDLQEYINEM